MSDTISRQEFWGLSPMMQSEIVARYLDSIDMLEEAARVRAPYDRSPIRTPTASEEITPEIEAAILRLFEANGNWAHAPADSGDDMLKAYEDAKRNLVRVIRSGSRESEQPAPSESAYAKVRAFHLAYGVDAPDSPTLADVATFELRKKLIDEEFIEYQDAVASGDLAQVADAVADLTYVVVGTAVAHGLTRFDEIFAEVHRSNMSKLGDDGRPLRREDGKVLKGPRFSPPNLAPLLTGAQR